MDGLLCRQNAGEISKGGFTLICGTALSHVVTILLRGSFAENGNGFAVFQLISRLRQAHARKKKVGDTKSA